MTYRGVMSSRPVLVFDGDCGFCTWSAGLVDGWAQGRIDVIAWQRADLAGLGLTADECSVAVQFVDRSGRWAGAAAIAHALVLCRVPGPSLGRLLLRPTVAPAAERAYALIAANRHRLPGATPACAV